MDQLSQEAEFGYNDLGRQQGLNVKIVNELLMLFVVYWKIDLNKLPGSMRELKQMEQEEFKEIEGLREIAAYVMTSGRAFNIIEADNADAVFEYIRSVASFFSEIEVSPALTFRQYIDKFAER